MKQAECGSGLQAMKCSDCLLSDVVFRRNVG